MSRHLLAISARSPAALDELAAAYAVRLGAEPDPIADLCAAAALGRDHHRHRLATVGGGVEEMADALLAWGEGSAPEAVAVGRQPMTGPVLELVGAPVGAWIEATARALAVLPWSAGGSPFDDAAPASPGAVLDAWRRLGVVTTGASEAGTGPFGVAVRSGAEAGEMIPLACAGSDDVLGALSRLYAAGADLDWRQVYARPRPLVDLPTYPWQRGGFWFDRPPSGRG